MSHLNTAYTMGEKQAEADFQVELQKLSAQPPLTNLNPATAPPRTNQAPIQSQPAPAPVKRAVPMPGGAGFTGRSAGLPPAGL